jgi:thiol-disulfide isomerase/thioredoxin
VSPTSTYTPPPAKKKPLPILPLALGAVVVVLAIGLALAFTAGEDEPAADGQGSTNPDLAGAELAAFGPVTVEGTPLPAFAQTEGDPAAGTPAPRLVGEAPSGTPTEVGGAGQPTLVAFLAHWCPHCQRELPVIVDLEEEGALDGMRTVAVLTGTDEAAPNYPPADWLIEEGWTGDVLVDDESTTAGAAYGLAGYPFLVFLDADGNVVARASGELGAEAITQLADAAKAA